MILFGCFGWRIFVCVCLGLTFFELFFFEEFSEK